MAARTAAARTRAGTSPGAAGITALLPVGLPGAEPLAEALARRLAAVAGEVDRERRVLDAMLPPVETLSDATTTQLRWNAMARADALREFGALSSADLAGLRGSRTANPHTTTSRWLSSGRVFAVDGPSGRLFPGFQFADGEPRPVVARVLEAMGGTLRGWELLAWFTGSCGFLGGTRPVDRLDDAPGDVAAAAARQASLSED